MSSPQSSSHGEDHGNTPAAWIAVALCIVGFLLGGSGLVLGVPALAITGGVVAVASPIVGKVLGVLGLGAPAK